MDFITPHRSVLLRECLEAFSGQRVKTFLDATLGAGGHAAAILAEHPEIERYIGFDQDPDALAIAKERLKAFGEKLLFVNANFSTIAKELGGRGIHGVSAVLMDLGVSSMQFDRPERGFSFRFDGPLDMRMGPSAEITAADIVNGWTEREIGKILRDFGEMREWRQAARAICTARSRAPIQTTAELAAVVDKALPKRPMRTHNPLTLLFQALRIAVNRELDVLKEGLAQGINALESGGRIAVISFQSLEDRIVKNAFRDEASDKLSTSGIGGLFLDREPVLDLVTRRPIVPSDEEIAENPRCRSAKLRVAVKR